MTMTLEDRTVALDDGLRVRYLEAGAGAPVILLHGGSLGSSADVFRRNLPPLAAAGLRVIAFDQPGFGKSDVPADLSNAYRRDSIPRFMTALGFERAALVAHSQAGGAAAQLALADPARFSHLVILSTGSLLPPASSAPGKPVGPPAKPAAPLEWQAGAGEPTLDDTRRALEDNLYHHELITPDELGLRHSHSIGQKYRAFVARQALDERPSKGASRKPDAKPLWQQLPDIKVPLLMIYGRDDRARAFERATLLKQTYPTLDLHIVPDCKHLLPWDASADFIRLAVPFLK